MKTLVWPLLLSLVAAPLAAQSIAGEWDASIETPGGVRPFKLILQVDAEKLTGTVRRQAGDVPLVGVIQDRAVRFSYTILYNGNPLELTVTAMLEGDSLKGSVDIAGAAEGEFFAVRVKPPAPPSPQPGTLGFLLPRALRPGAVPRPGGAPRRLRAE